MTAAYDDDELVTATEAARRLGLQRQSVMRWMHRRHLYMRDSTIVRGKEAFLFRWGDVVACAAEREANRQRYSTKP